MNDTTVSATLRALTNNTEQILTNRLRPLGITVTQLEFLAILSADPTLNGSQAAKAAHVCPQTGTTVLQNLVLRQLITIRRIPGTGRRNTITVTERGVETLAQAREAVADVEKRLEGLLGNAAVSKLSGAVAVLGPESTRNRPDGNGFRATD